MTGEMTYKLLYLASLVTFTFGALTFSVLTFVYWRERRLRRSEGGRAVFPVFTVVCAAAFLVNLLLQTASAENAGSAFVPWLTVALDLVAGLLPPVLFHLVYADEAAGLPRWWVWPLRALYAAAVLVAGAKCLTDAGVRELAWADSIDTALAAMPAAAATLGLAAQICSRSKSQGGELRHRLWIRALLILMAVSVAANLAQPGPFVGLLPDYVILAIFCVTLYYKERLFFFDLLIKRGVFFALALIVLTVFFAVAHLPWTWALLLTPFWLIGPWIYRRLEAWIDVRWLGRRYTTYDAERQFANDVQVSSTERDLARRATASLSDIFRAAAVVCFDETTEAPQDGLSAVLEHKQASLGWIRVAPRPDAVPYLSDDRRLLQALARTLAVVLENVRFREREQKLRSLASRAELKALRAQINPHFLFNALNAIAGLIRRQPELADRTIEQLAQVFRYTLRQSDTEWVRLDQEVEFAVSYLRVEQARFGPRLQVDLEIDPAAAAIPVPAMSIQPLVENAIKHGVSATEERGRVGLRARLQEGSVRIEVTDNGPGFPPGFSLEESEGRGLRNILDRLQGYYGGAAALHWETRRGETCVILEIPHAAPPELAGSALGDTRTHR
jgi:signal transduction histidine kinase